jgi:hypothetical protein
MKISYHSATITFKSGTVRSRLHQASLNRNFDISDDMDDLDWVSISQYTNFLSRAEIDGDIGFPVPHNGASEDEYRKGLEAFLEASEDFYDTVIVPLFLMDSGGNETALTPDVEKKV